jgi:hypothetical protein
MRGEDHLEGACGRYTEERQLVEGAGHVAEPWVISCMIIAGEAMGVTWYDEFIASVMAKRTKRESVWPESARGVGVGLVSCATCDDAVARAISE